MQTGDHEHLLRGRIRDWDGLIILNRLPVSTLLFISHPLFSLPLFLVVSEPAYFRLPVSCFSFIEFMDSVTHS
jgi:hypothetical protein